jgi:hypothetical protein
MSLLIAHWTIMNFLQRHRPLINLICLIPTSFGMSSARLVMNLDNQIRHTVYEDHRSKVSYSRASGLCLIHQAKTSKVHALEGVNNVMTLCFIMVHTMM